ncbi:hypothetical protein AC739_15190 [Planococcus glaciei]|uniref:ATP-binding protein n=1 Tax=Planococcus glaciei TaxID=459472 RepID=UPI00069FF393|nr:ATP-binding protein [Planococcus glaciei]KOF09464.1 hypothetical protein AC739_15190 [Planococcus glaciei]
MQRTNLVMDKTLFNRGFIHYHKIDWDKNPHMITIGASGSGKTFLNKLVIARVALKIPNSSTTVLDFKADDYHFARSEKNLHEFDKVKEGLENFYQEFLLRQQGADPGRSFKLLVIEELGSMMSYFDKKVVEGMKMMIANLIFMGRSANCHILISTQRPDTSYFNAGVRDSIGVVVALGNLSKEGKTMLFNDFKDEMKEKHGQGSGFMTNGTELFNIKVPQVKDIDILEFYIKQTLNR